MKIAIIGGGISGCFMYLSLKKKLPADDYDFILYEAYSPAHVSPPPSFPEGTGAPSASIGVGGGLGIAPNGLNCLKRLDEELFHDVVRSGYPYAFQQMKSANGWNLMRLVTSGAEPSISSVSISRHALWRCLRDRVPDNLVVHRRVAAVVANPNGCAVIRFDDNGPDVEADLIIGADGLKSVTKLALFPENQEDQFPPHYEGVVGVGGFIPAETLKDVVETDTMSLVFGGNGFFGYCYGNSDKDAPNRHIPRGILPPGDSVLWWSTYEIADCPDPKTIDKEAVLQNIKHRHGKWKSKTVQSILSMIQVENMYPVWTTPSLPTWHKDGVVLVGDAAHTLPPTSGQGVSQALEDVECLSTLLAYRFNRKHGPSLVNDGYDVESTIDSTAWAAKKYMEIRMPRIQAILEKARQFENKKRNLSLFEEYFMYFVLFLVGKFPTPSWAIKTFSYNIASEVQQVIDTSKD
ncbi:hypothetical protein FQN57_005559 [Myotisia sp. PD_48]|nr:hypothetical protein FQN57_005559 [Myotisia sp. PD_48]